MTGERHVVILGAGFAGIAAMRKLEKVPVRATLIDRNNYHSFLPLLYQVATCELDASEVGFPVRELLHDRSGFHFRLGAVNDVDLNAKTVLVDGLEPMSYDYLVLALGAVVNFFGTIGAAEHAFPLYTLRDAVRLKAHFLERLEAAATNPSLVDDGALRFCVVGGGATGVETAGALAELLQTEIKQDYPDLPLEKAEVHLFELGPQLLGAFKTKSQDYAKKALEQRHVQTHLNEGVVKVEPTRIHLSSGDSIQSHTLVWAAGLTPNPIIHSLAEGLVDGRVPVDADLSLPGHPEVFVIGDMAMITHHGKPLPQLGSVAQQAGQHAGANIARLVVAKSTTPFKYHDKGTMAIIGRGAAVAELQSGRTITGRAAWLAWLGIHLMLLSGGERKTLAFVDWAWNILRNTRGKRTVIK